MLNRLTGSRERIWDYLNIYYHKHKTTPSMDQISKRLKVSRPSVKFAVKTLVKEGYIRTSLRGTKKFIVLIRMGKYGMFIDSHEMNLKTNGYFPPSI